MSKDNNFARGFFIGSVIGGLVGSVVGIVLGSRSNYALTDKDGQSSDNSSESDYQSRLDSNHESSISLEDKISQLNSAIDDVRQKLNLVNNQEKDNN